jgi:hypothetical protein
MITHQVWYVFTFYRHLMSERERLAYSHLVGTMKLSHGRSDAKAQEEARAGKRPPYGLASQWLSDDSEVLRLARDGYEAFVESTGERIFRDHRDQIVLNYCPKCGQLARTPKARQCWACRHDWHDEITNSKKDSLESFPSG